MARPTILDGQYRLTGNAFNGNFNTWRMFPAKRGIKLVDLRKTDEERAVAVVASEAAKLGGIKIVFHKTIRLRREKAERAPTEKCFTT